MERIIDLNADVGEGLNNEHLLMPYLSSCNIACGGHAGNAQTIKETILLAKQNNVAVGVHPSYPDTKNFGRKVIDISHEELLISLREQIKLFQKVQKNEDATLHHLKPHGALYNQAAKEERIAKVIITLMQELLPQTKLYAPYGSVIAKLARDKNISVTYEAFADRRYLNTLQLVSRKHSRAIIEDPEEAFQQVYAIYSEQKVVTISKETRPLEANTFCVHGDHPRAVEMLVYLKEGLANKGIKISKCQ